MNKIDKIIKDWHDLKANAHRRYMARRDKIYEEKGGYYPLFWCEYKANEEMDSFIKSALQSAVKDALESTRLEEKEIHVCFYHAKGKDKMYHGYNAAVQTQQKLITKAIKSLTDNNETPRQNNRPPPSNSNNYNWGWSYVVGVD